MDILVDEKVGITNNDEVENSTHEVLLQSREMSKLINYFLSFRINEKVKSIDLVFTLLKNDNNYVLELLPFYFYLNIFPFILGN